MHSIIPLLIGWGLDLCAGDPARLPHPIVAFGRWISFFERKANHGDHRRAKGTFWTVTTLCTLFLSAHLALAALWTACLQWEAGGTYLYYLVTGILIFYCLAGTTLIREVRMVFCAADRSLEEGRRQVSRIVGRDTQRLDRAGVTRAAVETVAENFSDGVAAPLFYFFLGGAPLALCYKAINTMDSMVGYRNERYLYFGRWAARLDDGANWLPARLSALLLVAAAWLLGEDGRGAWRIWRRDRRNHASPNAAQTEAAMAGALGVQLAGPAWYFGIRVEKPTIGEHQRPIVPEDILRSNRLLYGGSVLCLGVLIGLRCALVLGGGIG